MGKTKEHKGVGSRIFFFFPRMSAFAFQRLDSSSAVKQNTFGKLIRLCKLFRFSMRLNGKSSTCRSLQVHKHVSLSPFFSRQWPRGLLLEQVQCGGGLLLRERDVRVAAPSVCSASGSFNFSKLVVGVNLFFWQVRILEDFNPANDVYPKFTFIVFSNSVQRISVRFALLHISTSLCFVFARIVSCLSPIFKEI